MFTNGNNVRSGFYVQNMWIWTVQLNWVRRLTGNMGSIHTTSTRVQKSQRLLSRAIFVGSSRNFNFLAVFKLTAIFAGLWVIVRFKIRRSRYFERLQSSRGLMFPFQTMQCVCVRAVSVIFDFITPRFLGSGFTINSFTTHLLQGHYSCSFRHG